MFRNSFLGAMGWTFFVSTLLLALAGQEGCGGSGVRLGRVTGKVTLAGQPLPDALVTFSPVAGGSPSGGKTAADGTYTLVYSRKDDGALVGEHTVTISTFQPEMEDPPAPAVPEKVPFKYREAEELPKVTVKSGSNTLDFNLEAGPIEPPAPAKGRMKSKAGDIRCY